MESNKLPTRPNNSFLLLLCLFFFSGLSALAYQVVWQRKLVDLFGISIYGVTVIVAAYMGGLGFGSFYAAKISSRIRNSIHVFCLIELSIGIFGIFSIDLFNTVFHPAYFHFRHLLPSVLHEPLDTTLAFTFFLFPTFLMGMSLPILAHGTISHGDDDQKKVGLLYGFNTAGAALGALLTGLFFIEIMGMKKTTITAGIINIAIGLSAALMIRATNLRNEIQAPTAASSKGRSLFLWMSFLVGLIGIGYEIFAFRFLTVLLADIAYIFPLLLFFYLSFLGFGSIKSSSFIHTKGVSDRKIMAQAMKLLSSLIFFVAGGFVLSQIFKLRVYELMHVLNTFIVDPLFVRPGYFQSAIFVLFFLLLPGLVFGSLFPMFVALHNRVEKNVGKSVGMIYLFNTLGSITGAFLFGIIILPNAGSEFALFLIILVPIILMAIKIKDAGLSSFISEKRNIFSGLIGLAALILICCGFKIYPVSVLAKSADFELEVVDSVEGKLGVSTVYREKRPYGEYHYIHTNNTWAVGTFRKDEDIYYSTKDYISYLIVLLSLSEVHDSFFLGLGGGGTACIASLKGQSNSVTIAEINQEIYDLVFKHIPLVRKILQDSPNVKLVTMDGQRYLRDVDTPAKFDLISVTGFRPGINGTGHIYSKEFFQLAKEKLSNKGFMTLNSDDDATLLTARESFEHNAFLNGTLICSKVSIRPSIEKLRNLWVSLPDEIRSYVPWEELIIHKQNMRFIDLKELSVDLPDGLKASTKDLPTSEFQLLRSHFIKKKKVYFEALNNTPSEKFFVW